MYWPSWVKCPEGKLRPFSFVPFRAQSPSLGRGEICPSGSDVVCLAFKAGESCWLTHSTQHCIRCCELLLKDNGHPERVHESVDFLHVSHSGYANASATRRGLGVSAGDLPVCARMHARTAAVLYYTGRRMYELKKEMLRREVKHL